MILGDASIILQDEAGGMSFKYPEDVDDEFVGQDGDEPTPITIGGVDINVYSCLLYLIT